MKAKEAAEGMTGRAVWTATSTSLTYHDRSHAKDARVLRSLGVSARPDSSAWEARQGSVPVTARRRRRAATLWFTAAAAVAGAGCGWGDRSNPRVAADAAPGALVVARVGDVAITADDVAAQMAARPGVDRRRALEDRILFELLAREAARHDLPSDTPDERAALIAVEAQRLVERDIEPRLTRAAISDADVRAVYERNRPRFVHGRLVQTAVVHVLTPVPIGSEGDTPAAAPALADQQPAPDPTSEAAALTSRELQILRCLAHGQTTPAIAKVLAIAHVTVRNHTQSILQKLDVHSKLEAVVRARALGIA